MKKGYLYIVLAALLYSTQEISGKFLATTGKMDPIQVTFIVFTIGTIILAPMAFKEMKKEKLKLTAKDWAYFIPMGILCVPVSMLCLQFAVTYTAASTSAVVFCSNAIFTIPFAVMILKSKISKTDLISMAISIVGVIVIFNPLSLLNGMTGGRNLIGILYALVAAVAWAIFNVCSKTRIGYYGSYVLNFFCFLVGIIVLFLILVITKRPILSGIAPQSVIILLYMGIFIKAFSYIFFLGAVKLTSPVMTSMVFLIKPALATILAIVLLGETIVPNVVIGILFVLVGSFVSFSSNRKAEKEKQKLASANPQ
ncbi:MAG: DMT family transporter [Ruminococcaceae bacterium]|jgi:Predicted permease, DMT superfamily|nr:DMT family transporter [Oscillospiraceae bacterium]